MRQRSDFSKATGRSYVSAGMMSVKNTYPSFSLSLAVFIILVCAADLTAVDTSVLLLMQHQKIKLAMIYVFSQFLEFFEIKTKCCSFVIPKRQNGVLIFLKLYFSGIFHEY